MRFAAADALGELSAVPQDVLLECSLLLNRLASGDQGPRAHAKICLGRISFVVAYESVTRGVREALNATLAEMRCASREELEQVATELVQVAGLIVRRRLHESNALVLLSRVALAVARDLEDS